MFIPGWDPKLGSPEEEQAKADAQCQKRLQKIFIESRRRFFHLFQVWSDGWKEERHAAFPIAFREAIAAFRECCYHHTRNLTLCDTLLRLVVRFLPWHAFSHKGKTNTRGILIVDDFGRSMSPAELDVFKERVQKESERTEPGGTGKALERHIKFSAEHPQFARSHLPSGIFQGMPDDFLSTALHGSEDY